MVDAQAPGVAATLRALPADLVTADWPGRALHALGGLHLLAQAHQQLDDLPEELAATVRSPGRLPGQQGDGAGPSGGVGSLVGDRGASTPWSTSSPRRRIWLRGLDTGRWAMWLTVAPPGRDLDLSIRPGRTYACCGAASIPGPGSTGP